MATNNTKQATWIAVGSLFSYGFGIVSSMILSRYFDKADYGTYKQVIYVYNTLLTVFTLGLPRAYSYFLPRVPIGQAKDLIKKITNIFFVLGSVFSIFLFVFSNQISIILKNPDLDGALMIFAIVPLLMLPTMGLEGVLATFKKTQYMTFYTIITRVFKLLCVALPVMIWNYGYKEALIGFVISDVIAFVIAMYLMNMPVKGAGDEKCEVTIKDIFNFSLPLLYASIFGMITASADQFFVSRYYGNEVFAEFSNGNINLPFVGMIMGACSAVLSPIFSKMNHEKLNPKTDIYPLWKNVFDKTAKLVYPLVIYCLVFADVVMVVLYGRKYTDSSFYFQMKLIDNFFRIIAYAPLLINIGKVKLYSNVQMYGAIVLVLLEIVCVEFFDTAYSISIVSMLCCLGRVFVYLYAVSKIFEVRFLQLFPIDTFVKILLPSTIILLVERYILINLFEIQSYLAVFIISFIIYGLVFFVISLPLKLNYIVIVKSLKK